MKVVIQCAARKGPSAGRLRTPEGRPVMFVAQPALAPPDGVTVFARPDDASGDGRTWRQVLLDNNNPATNALGLLPAFQLYGHDSYRGLVHRFGVQHVFILSAGWGLIPADFLTPDYDITFSASAESWKRRRKDDRYEDLRIIPDDGDDVVFLGGKDYLPLFCRLTADLRGNKTVFFNSATAPDLPRGFRAIRYPTTTRTNWHYEAARSLMAGEIGTG